MDLDLAKISEDDLAIIACNGDRPAIRFLWEASTPLVAKLTGRFASRIGGWIDWQDVRQNVMLEVPKIIKRYKPALAKKGWSRYLACSLYRATQDVLRREDPLGVSIPQKKSYPVFCRLTDLTCDPVMLDMIVNKGAQNLDAGHVMQEGPCIQFPVDSVGFRQAFRRAYLHVPLTWERN